MLLPSLHRLSLREEDPTDAPIDELGAQEIEDLLESMKEANDPNDPCLENLRAFCMSSASPYMRTACDTFFERQCRDPPFFNLNGTPALPFLCHQGQYNPYLGNADVNDHGVYFGPSGPWWPMHGYEGPYEDTTPQWGRQWFLFCRVWHAPNQIINRRINAITVLRRLGNPGMTTIPDQVFWQFYHVDLDTLPSTIVRIGTQAFFHCQMITRMRLRQNLRYIGVEAFAHCHALETVHVPNSVRDILEGAFTHCYSLRSARLPPNNPNFVRIAHTLFMSCSELRRIHLPASVNAIGASAFRGCISLERLRIPNAVDAIGHAAFRDCRSLERLELPENDEFDTIPTFMCQDCTSLRRIVIPQSVETIRDHAFDGCTSLVHVDVGRNVREVHVRTFAGCPALRRLRLPDWNAYPPGRIDGSAIEDSPNVRVFVGDEDITDTLRAGVSLNFN